MTEIQHTIDTDTRQAYRAEHEGWSYHVAFNDRSNKLAVCFLGATRLETLFEVVAYAFRLDGPSVSVRLGANSNVQSTRSDLDTAHDLMRELRRLAAELESA